MGGRKRNLYSAQAARSRRSPTGRRRAISRCSLGLFRDWRRTQTQSSVTALGPDTANGCPVLQRQEPQPRGNMRAGSSVASLLRAPQKARVERRVFSLDNDLYGRRLPGRWPLVGQNRMPIDTWRYILTYPSMDVRP